VLNNSVAVILFLHAVIHLHLCMYSYCTVCTVSLYTASQKLTKRS